MRSWVELGLASALAGGWVLAGSLGASACSSSRNASSAGDGGRDAGREGDARTGEDYGDAKKDGAAPEAGCALSPTCNACLATDDGNCGACGHACGTTGSCLAGMCSVVLASGQGSAPDVVNDLIVDDASVYWMPAASSSPGAGRILSVAKSGSGAPITIASGIAQPEGLSQDDAYLYFVSHFVGIERVPKTGGTKTFLLEDGTIDGGAVFPEFWLLPASPDLFYVGGLATNIFDLPITGLSTGGSDGGSSPVAVTDGASLLGAPGTGYFALAVDDAGIYYDTTSEIVVLDRATRAPVGLVPGSSASAGDRFGPTLAVDATDIYFISNLPADGGVVSSVAKVAKSIDDAGVTTILTSDAVSSTDGPMMVDATTVYWPHVVDSVTRAGVLVSVPKSGGAVVTVATGCYGQCPFALDATNVYWAAGDGTIRAAPKAP